jgi:hypothetical protein
MTTITVHPTAKVPTPRGAIWAAAGAVAILRLLHRWLDARDGAKLTQDADDVRRVRALARSYASTDPGFASDLLAAADRHEVMHTR